MNRKLWRYWAGHWWTHLRMCKRNGLMNSWCVGKRDRIKAPEYERMLFNDFPRTSWVDGKDPRIRVIKLRKKLDGRRDA